MDDDDDYGYEIGQDDLREKLKQYESYDDFGDEIGYDFSRKSSKKYYRNDDESEDCKLLREVLKKLECKLSLLKSVKWRKPNATVFGAAESMKEMLDEILKMKDTYDQRREEENVQTVTNAVEKNLKDNELKLDENNVQTVTDAETEKDAVEKNLKNGEQQIEEENVQTMTNAETEKDTVEKNLKGDERKIDESFKKLQLNSANELKEGKVAAADLEWADGENCTLRTWRATLERRSRSED